MAKRDENLTESHSVEDVRADHKRKTRDRRKQTEELQTEIEDPFASG